MKRYKELSIHERINYKITVSRSSLRLKIAVRAELDDYYVDEFCKQPYYMNKYYFDINKKQVFTKKI